MEKMPHVRFVYDRRKTATKSSARDAREGTVEIEIYHGRKRRLVSTGVRVYADQWSDRYKVKSRLDASELNAVLDTQFKAVSASVSDIMERYGEFTFERLEASLTKEKQAKTTFLAFMEKRVEERRDIRESTRKHHRVIVGELKAFGRIVEFADLTPGNIMLYDDYMRSNGLEQTTIYAHHKNLITYIHQAYRFGLTDVPYPYADLRISRGRTSKHNFLTVPELRKIERCTLPTEALSRSRDLFLFMCYTGLSYADMYKLSFDSDVVEKDGKFVLVDDRVKTGEGYQVVFIPQAMSIIDRYGRRLPVITNQRLNTNLKLVALYAGLQKQISCHDARRTFCSIAINNGVNIEVVAKMLGHSSSKTTAAFYSRITDESVERGFDDISAAFKGIRRK